MGMGVKVSAGAVVDGQAGTTQQRWTPLARDFVASDAGRSVLIAGGDVSVGVAATVERPGASVLKLFVAAAVYRCAASGSLDVARPVAVGDLPPSRYPAVISSLDPDHRFSIGELARLALATSDNRIAHHLVELLGPAQITQVAHAVGCTSTYVRVGFGDEWLGPLGRANVTTAADCATVLGAIATQPALAPLRPALRSSLFNHRILRQLPDDVVVSHKTGSLAGVVNDVGMIHAPSGDLTVCFLTDDQADPARTADDIASCARAAFDAWEDR